MDPDQTAHQLAVTRRALEITRAQLAQTVDELALVTLALDAARAEATP